jgi:hypothetical protein
MIGDELGELCGAATTADARITITVHERRQRFARIASTILTQIRAQAN